MFFALPAFAHKPSDSYLTLEVTGAHVEGRWDIALRDLDYTIGLDADATLREFLERFPDPQAPVAGAAEGRRTAKRTPAPPRTAPRPAPRQSAWTPCYGPSYATFFLGL